MLSWVLAGLDVLIPDLGICANRNVQVLMQLRWENCTSECPWDLLLLEFQKRIGVVLRELGMGHPSVFLCLLGIFSVGRPSSAVGKPRSWGLSWVWASVASLHGRHCVLALSWVICCENQPYSGILLPCVLSTVLSHLGQVIPGILWFFFHFLTSYLKLLCIFRVFSRGCFGGLDLGFFCALCWKLWLSLT